MLKRPINLDEFQIDRERYGELRYFCLQYEKKKRQLADLMHATPDPGQRSGTRPLASNPVAAIAIKRDQLLCDCEIIEQAALEAVGGSDEHLLYQCLLRHVTSKGKPPVDLVPCGYRQFYQYRRKFFFLLDQKKG